MVTSELMGFGKREPLGQKRRELGALVSVAGHGAGCGSEMPSWGTGSQRPSGAGKPGTELKRVSPHAGAGGGQEWCPGFQTMGLLVRQLEPPSGEPVLSELAVLLLSTQLLSNQARVSLCYSGSPRSG